MTVATTALPEPSTRRWTRREFYRLAEEGWFRGQRVQLIQGEIIEIPPQGHAHTTAVLKTQRFLCAAFDENEGYVIRTQMPLNLGRDSDPEPDLAVVRGRIEDYSDHPTTALLIVEVSDTTLRLDRRKAGLYAAAGIAEYWIVNLNERQVEVHRSPQADGEYAERRVISAGESLAPLGRSTLSIKVMDLLP